MGPCDSVHICDVISLLLHVLMLFSDVFQLRVTRTHLKYNHTLDKLNVTCSASIYGNLFQTVMCTTCRNSLKKTSGN